MRKSRAEIPYADLTDYERWRRWEAALEPVSKALEEWNVAGKQDGMIVITDTSPDEIGRPWCWPATEREIAESFWTVAISKGRA